MITKRNLLLFFLLVLFIVPWFNYDAQGSYSIPKVSQEDVSFYEINPCKVSLFQFISSNTESVYQNHFYFRPDNKSSIQCFGRISGVTVLQKGIETQFFITVGTNSFINLLFQGFFWIFIFNLIPASHKPKTKKENSKYRYKNISILLVSYLFTYSIYAESRFYEKSLYIFNFDEFRSYFLIFLLFYIISKNLIDIFIERSQNTINYIPFIYFFTSLFSGFNYSFIATIFIYLGIKSFLEGTQKSRFSFIYFLVALWWLFNSNGSFYFNVGKLRGFTSSVYEFNANLFWILFFYFLVRGMYKYYLENRAYFKLELFSKNLSITALLMLFTSIISSNLPLVNFLNYYFLGLQRNVVESNNPFAFDEFDVKISWRGIFPSSETVGEFYGLVLLFLLFWIILSKQLRTIDTVGILSASAGLYFSDNRTAMVLVFALSIIYIYKKLFSSQINKRFALIFIFSLIIGFSLILFLNTSLKFASDSLWFKAGSFQYDSIYSSFLSLINSNYESNSIFSYIFASFSILAFFLNRSEMWGLFFSRYNPTFMEVLFGTGPSNFGQLYGETVINNPDSLLLPHSSFLSALLFIGIIPLLFLIFLLIRTFIKYKYNTEFVLVTLYLITNMFKNDSINYLVVFVFYGFVFLILKNNIRKNLFAKPLIDRNIQN